MVSEYLKGMREKLKEEIKKLESKFPSDHSRLTVTAQRSLDEITVTFKRKCLVSLSSFDTHLGFQKKKMNL